MNDAADPAEPTPGDEAAVRRLLAEARHTGPVPPEVEARLDASLARLTAERADGAAPASPTDHTTVVPLTRRRRLGAAALLAAAAVVVVGGMLGGQALREGGGDDASSADAGAVLEDQADRVEDEGGNVISGDAELDEGPDATQAPPPGSSDGQLTRARAVPRLSGDDLVDDLLDLRERLPRPTATTGRLIAPPAFQCRSVAGEQGVLVGVEYDGEPAVAAFRPARGESQVVDLLRCGSGDVLRSTTLPVR